ncbi:MAG TPA: hypothetical protein VFF48_01675 [Brevundimonas sp.]|nr:hypothetical protein [Brevundimonas sp.]
MKTVTCVGVAMALCLQGCASTPRAFEPRIAAAPADLAAYEAAFVQCSNEVAAGRRSSFRSGRGGSAAGGVAVAGAVGVVTAGSAASGAGMLAGAAAGAGLLVGFALAAPFAFYGLSRVQRARKEAEIKDAMTLCLAEEGHVVTDWVRPEAGSTGMRSPTAPAAIPPPAA